MHLSEVNTLLYHAIPLNDFKTYAKEGGILSRERLSSANPYFTRFFSDPKDVKLKCWNRTFANFTDLGANFAFFDAACPNAFGPINIVLSNSALKSALENQEDVKVTRVSISQQNYNPENHDVDIEDIGDMFDKKPDRYYIKSEHRGLELSCSQQCIKWEHVAYILVDPINYAGKNLKQEVEEILFKNNIEKKVVERILKDPEVKIDILKKLTEWSETLAGRLLHKNEDLQESVPAKLAEWYKQLPPVGRKILASWLTYTYNGTLLHLK